LAFETVVRSSYHVSQIPIVDLHSDTVKLCLSRRYPVTLYGRHPCSLWFCERDHVTVAGWNFVWNVIVSEN